MIGSAGMLLATGCRFGAPGGSTRQGTEIGNLYHLFFYVAIGMGGLVYGLILYAAVRYRRRSDDLPDQRRYHVPLEIAYTAVPFLIVLALFSATFRTETGIDAVSHHPAAVVRVTGFQWQWRFEYLGRGVSIVGTPDSIPTMVVPVGETVRIDLVSLDVIHSFFVPEFLFKRDAIPGQPNRFDLVIPRAGRFRGECAEYCGLDHGDMTFFVKAVPRSAFDGWLAKQGAGGR